MSYKLTVENVLRQAVNKVQVYGNSIDWVKALLLPGVTLNTSFVSEVERLRTRNQYSSQVMSLTARLNNLFDDTQRRIYIETIPPLFVQFVYKEESTNKTFAYSQSNARQFITYADATLKDLAALGINFVVYVPPTILAANVDLIKSEVGFYALAGKNWVVRSNNEIITVPSLLAL